MFKGKNILYNSWRTSKGKTKFYFFLTTLLTLCFYEVKMFIIFALWNLEQRNLFYFYLLERDLVWGWSWKESWQVVSQKVTKYQKTPVNCRVHPPFFSTDSHWPDSRKNRLLVIVTLWPQHVAWPSKFSSTFFDPLFNQGEANSAVCAISSDILIFRNTIKKLLLKGIVQRILSGIDTMLK
jgi:hypothetical protein